MSMFTITVGVLLCVFLGLVCVAVGRMVYLYWLDCNTEHDHYHGDDAVSNEGQRIPVYGNKEEIWSSLDPNFIDAVENFFAGVKNLSTLEKGGSECSVCHDIVETVCEDVCAHCYRHDEASDILDQCIGKD